MTISSLLNMVLILCMLKEPVLVITEISIRELQPPQTLPKGSQFGDLGAE